MIRSNFKLSTALIMLIAMAVSIVGCKKEDPILGDPPTEADAQFTYQASSTSDNIIEFTAANSSLDATWDFGNGATAKGSNVTAEYPFAGTYTVRLTVQNSGGSASSTQDITIAQDDPTLIDNPIFDFLTGGASGSGSKTWVIDSTADGHFGVGPAPSHPDFDGYYPKWYAATSLEKTGSGMYNDMYIFKLQGFGFDMISNGDVYVNTEHAGTPPFDDTMSVIVNDFIANFPDQLGETWTLDEGSPDTTITLSGDAMIGYWAGTRTYRIVTINENELFLGFQDSKNADLFWYIKLVPEGMVSVPPTPAPNYSLPLDFETVEPEFTVFGNSTYAIIDNPDQSGINTSSRVLETVHGNETWAGLFVNLENKLDFSTMTSIKLKVWSPITGPFRLKLEDQDDPNSFVEVDVDVTTTNQWEELTFDMTGTPADFNRLVIFPGWNVADAGTFYVDDIIQE